MKFSHITRHDIPLPVRLLELDSTVLDINDATDGTYAAMIGFELDFSLQELRFVGAGITQFFVNGKKLEMQGMFVGVWEKAKFTAGVLPMKAGDSIFFLTDGYTDILSQPNFFGFGSPGGEDFESDLVSLRQLAEKKGRLRDDATGVCLKLA